eukprot:Skav213377  [mRNA]  locus=scaffold797:150678:151321:+ [translate_table: standard]
MVESEFLDAATSRLLIKKTWCHGQIVAAFQGVLYFAWGYESTEISNTWRRILMSSIVLLPIWSIVSWRSMKGRRAYHAWIILVFGSALLVFYAAVIWIALQDDQNLYQLGLVILTALQCMETSAYLVVVACLKDSLLEDDTDAQYQYSLI